MTLDFFMQMIPPTTTAQMRQVRVVNGRPMFYEPEKVKEARYQLVSHLEQHMPDRKLAGPLRLDVLWIFPPGKTHKDGEWKITRPDTDNLEKLLKDCMTDYGFWSNDAQVAIEYIEKRWGNMPGIRIRLEELNGDETDT